MTTAYTEVEPAFVPVQTRSERPRSFEPAEFGTPNGREVNWKHTPVAQLSGLFSPAAQNDGVVYEIENGDGFVEGALPAGTAPRGEFFVPEDIVAAVAWQGSSEGMHVRIPRNEEVSEPILVTITGQGADQRADAHIVIEALENSSATVVLRHRGSAQYAQNVEIIARPGSRLTVISVQRWDDDAVHAASHQARVDKDAYLKHFVISFGGGVVRVNPTVELAGTGSEGRMYGLSYADAGQHLESQVYLHHKGAYTTGDVLYKGALQGVSAQRACGVNELEQDAPLRVELDGVPIAIVRDSNDEIHAIGDTCTHGEISLSEGFVEGDTLECWAHGSAFSLRTGIPQNLPAFEPVPVYVVEIDGDDVLIDPTVTKEV